MAAPEATDAPEAMDAPEATEPSSVATNDAVPDDAIPVLQAAAGADTPDQDPTLVPEDVHVPCVAPEGVPNPPRSILSVIDFLNAMPRPVTIPCFLEALPRPLQLYATRGILSAQPATGARSPRIFVFLDPLAFSIVPDGKGQNLLELGELQSTTRSLKAEIEFPLEEELPRSEPFERLMYNDEITTCAFCHGSEELDPAIEFTDAYVSRALRPVPSEQVALDDLLAEHQVCDPEAEPARCAMFDALFDWGDVVEWYFPEDMETFY
jgi:hypothetical protein